MANDPCTLAFRFTGFEFFDQVPQYAGLVRIGEIEEVEDVIGVPKVCVYRDDSKSLSSGVSVRSIMR